MAFCISWSCAPGPLGVSFQGSWVGWDSQRNIRVQKLLALEPPDFLLLQDMPRTVSVVMGGGILPCAPPKPHHDRHGVTSLLTTFTQQRYECSGLLPQPQAAASLLRLCTSASLFSQTHISGVASRILCCWASFFPCDLQHTHSSTGIKMTLRYSWLESTSYNTIFTS